MKSQLRKDQQALKRASKLKRIGNPSGKSKYALKVKARRTAAGLKTEDAV